MNNRIGWWYVIWSKDNKDILAGPYPTKKKAITERTKAIKGHKAKMLTFPTRNLALAAQMYKVKR